MRKKRFFRWVLGIPALVVVLIFIILMHEPEKDGITRAMAAKSVALAVQSPEELESWQQEYGASHFSAETLEQWYVIYLDYLYENGYLSEELTPADEKTAEGVLTYEEAAGIAAAVSPELESQIHMTKQNREKPYPEESWWLFYDSLLKRADPEGKVEVKSVLVYGTVENVPDTPAWTAHTNLGLVRFDGLALDGSIDHELSVYMRGSQIIHIREDRGADVTYQNVWLVDGTEEELTVYVGDIERKLPFRKKSKNIDEIVHNLADIRLEDGKVTKVSLKKERITAKVLSVQEDGIELEGYGLVPFDDEYLILKTYGDLKRQELTDILVGYDMQEFVVAKGKICAVLTVRAFEADEIRVLLMNNGFQGLYHDSVTIACDGAVTLTQGDESWQEEAGTELTFLPGDERLQAGRLILEPEDGKELKVASLTRGMGQPSYAGRLELLDTEQGLVLINELYLEDYLKKVVPSEMPTEYEKEALKAQAVCARTYACMQIQSNTYSQYGAHVDDSTNFQVYNNIETDSRAAAAVEETYGKLLLYDGSPISAYYFSTSCGTTADGGVWGGDPEKTPYLKSVALQPGRKTLDLTSNQAFSEFIRNMDVSAYDASYPFFRWNVTTNADILSENISGVGTVQSVQVTERLAGGVANKLLVKGTEGERTITGQNSIRSALGDQRLTIKRKDGKTSEGWSSLPSGFLTVEDAGTNSNGVRLFKIYGGGYGHGAGMSQNGAQGMAKDGMNYEEILKFFYDGVTVEELTE